MTEAQNQARFDLGGSINRVQQIEAENSPKNLNVSYKVTGSNDNSILSVQVSPRGS
jgi:hypothetical protein